MAAGLIRGREREKEKERNRREMGRRTQLGLESQPVVTSSGKW